VLAHCPRASCKRSDLTALATPVVTRATTWASRELSPSSSKLRRRPPVTRRRGDGPARLGERISADLPAGRGAWRDSTVPPVAVQWDGLAEFFEAENSPARRAGRSWSTSSLRARATATENRLRLTVMQYGEGTADEEQHAAETGPIVGVGRCGTE